MSDEEERMRILKARIAELEAARAREAAAAAAADDEEEEDVGEEEHEEEDGEEAAAATTTEDDEEEVEQATDDTNADAAVEELSEELADTQVEDKENVDDVDAEEVEAEEEEEEEEVVAEEEEEVKEEPAVPKVAEEEEVKEEEEDDDGVDISQQISEQKLQSLKSKREQEFEELRKIAAARKLEEGGELSAFERMKLKKQQELDALRARGGVNAKNKSRFDTGQALTTDMSAWSRNQRLAAEEARKKRMEASESLKKTSAQSMSSWERNQLLDKDEARRRQMEAREGLHQYRTSLDPTATSDVSESSPAKASTRHAIATHDAEKDLQTIEKRRVSFKDNLDDDIVPSSQPEQQQIEQPKEEEPEEPESAVRPSLLRAQQEPAKAHSYGLKPPAYSRVDIKFSFGLVVKSGTTDESLRDSETLRKCMNGTREILTDELPPPPDYNNMGEKSSMVSFKVKFPQAYYDPILEPTVISIEEDTSKKPAKGKNNTRTLCKASFPVFIRDEATDEEGKKRAALTLKETKATIFKALRAAVSGGKFLK